MIKSNYQFSGKKTTDRRALNEKEILDFPKCRPSDEHRFAGCFLCRRMASGFKGWWYEIDDDDDDFTENDFDYDDYAKNGWKWIDREWYYFNPEGYMLTGWVHDGDDWYYLTSDGSLLTNAYTPDGYWVDAEGEWDGLDDRFDDDWDDPL